jgi:hypothetical protein
MTFGVLFLNPMGNYTLLKKHPKQKTSGPEVSNVTFGNGRSTEINRLNTGSLAI